MVKLNFKHFQLLPRGLVACKFRTNSFLNYIFLLLLCFCKKKIEYVMHSFWMAARIASNLDFLISVIFDSLILFYRPSLLLGYFRYIQKQSDVVFCVSPSWISSDFFFCFSKDRLTRYCGYNGAWRHVGAHNKGYSRRRRWLWGGRDGHSNSRRAGCAGADKGLSLCLRFARCLHTPANDYAWRDATPRDPKRLDTTHADKMLRRS